MSDALHLAGGCHCGAVRFVIDTSHIVIVLDCNCSICSKTGFLHLIVEAGEFRLLTDPAALSTYSFGTHTAQHLFCTRCGIKSLPATQPSGRLERQSAGSGRCQRPDRDHHPL